MSRLLTKIQAADLLNISVSTLSKMLRDKVLPHVRLRTSIRIRHEDVVGLVNLRAGWSLSRYAG